MGAELGLTDGINFIVPIRHPADVQNPEAQQRFLAQLFLSIRAQTDTAYRCYIACSPEQQLPDLPERFARVDIDLPPNHALAESESRGDALLAVHLDKGTRVGTVAAQLPRDALMMSVDEDDLIHRDLVADIRSSGWTGGHIIDKGYAMPDPQRIFPLENLHQICGTSVIVPVHYYSRFRGDTDQIFTTRELGSHKWIYEDRVDPPRHYRRIPFRAAIYRTSHKNSTQRFVKTRPQIQTGPLRRRPQPKIKERKAEVPFIDRDHPLPLTQAVREDFFGAGQSLV